VALNVDAARASVLELRLRRHLVLHRKRATSIPALAVRTGVQRLRATAHPAPQASSNRRDLLGTPFSNWSSSFASARPSPPSNRVRWWPPPQAPSHGTLPKAVRMRRSDARARSELKVETHPTLLDTLLSAFIFRS